MKAVNEMQPVSNELPASVVEKLKKIDTFHYHLGSPEVDPDIYSLARRFALADRALSRKRIYLDSKYWVYLREASIGHSARPQHRKILELLLHLVDSGKIWCPLSYDIFAEWLKLQPTSRLVSARMMDRLSGGLMLQMEMARTSLEISHYVWTRLLNVSLRPLSSYMWIPVGYPVGEVIPTHTAFPESVEKAMQKAMYDVFSSMSLTDIAATTQDDPPSLESDEQLQRRQTLFSAMFRFSIKSFDEVFKIEVGGTSDLWVEAVHDFASNLIAKGLVMNLTEKSPRDATEYAQDIVALLVAGLKLRRISTELPCLHIHPSIHAAMRFRRQRFQRGDLHDFHHAVGALSYYNAFFTERRLANLLRDPLIRLDKLYNCDVIHDDDKIIEYLENLN